MYKLIKHRGIHNKDIKENTYESIKLALQDSKYIGVEFDVRETIDHEFIIYHDPIFNNKLISKSKYDELSRYIPKLDNILKINSNKVFLIEIKNITDFSKFINLLNKHKDKNIYVMSFSTNLINNINVKKRKYKIGLLNYVINTNFDNKKLDFIVILNSLINKHIINEVKPLEVFSYGLLENLKYEEVYYIVDK